MHIPKKFQQNDIKKLEQLIHEEPFSTLITYSEAGLEANHIPLILHSKNGKNVLQGHIAKANPLWKTVQDKSTVLAVFNGPHSYITPNYYPSKQENGKAVPTWNYMAVHVKGIISYIDDQEWNLSLITRLTNKQEASQKKPWAVDDAPDDYIRKMLPAIIGIEIEIISMEGQWKSSQNQPENNQQGVIAGLSEDGKTQEESNMSSLQKMAQCVQQATNKA